MATTINNTSTGFTSPGYEKVHTNLLAREKNFVDQSLKPIRDSWGESSVSIVSDGWEDGKNRPLINVITVSPKGTMFFRAVDYERQLKDAKFISKILFDCIDMVGHENAV